MKVQLFAKCRDAAKASEIKVDYIDGETIAEFKQRVVGEVLGEPTWVRSIVVAVNNQVLDADETFLETDELALIPPVSGGATKREVLTDSIIDMNKLLVEVQKPENGAVVLFLGVVRNHHEGKKVDYLEYEAYPSMAEAKLNEIIDEINAKWSDVDIALIHRTGELKVGEVSIAIAAGSPHRAEAFEAARHAIERVKVTVPIWKKEFSPDGVSWVEGAVLES